MDVGQAKVSAGVTKGEAFVIQAQDVQDRRVKVVHVDGVFFDVITYVVGLAIGTRLDAGAGHPHGEGMGMMVTPIETLFQG